MTELIDLNGIELIMHTFIIPNYLKIPSSLAPLPPPLQTPPLNANISTTIHPIHALSRSDFLPKCRTCLTKKPKKKKQKGYPRPFRSNEKWVQSICKSIHPSIHSFLILYPMERSHLTGLRPKIKKTVNPGHHHNHQKTPSRRGVGKRLQHIKVFKVIRYPASDSYHPLILTKRITVLVLLLWQVG